MIKSHSLDVCNQYEFRHVLLSVDAEIIIEFRFVGTSALCLAGHRLEVGFEYGIRYHHTPLAQSHPADRAIWSRPQGGLGNKKAAHRAACRNSICLTETSPTVLSHDLYSIGRAGRCR